MCCCHQESVNLIGMGFPLLSKKQPFSVSCMDGISPLFPCWPFCPFLTQQLPVPLPCHLRLVPLTQCCYFLLLLDFFTLVAQKLTLCSAPLAFPTFFLVPLYLHSFCWKRIDALRKEHCLFSRFLGTAIVWRHHSMPQAGMMKDSCITHLCSSYNRVSGCRAVKPS